MTYKLNPNLKKIQSLLIVIIDGTEREYRNGEDLTEQVFEKPYMVDSITARSNRIVIHLRENDRMNAYSEIGQSYESISFF